MSKNLNDRLKEMVGKTYLYNTYEHKVFGFIINEEEFTLMTNKRELNFPTEKASQVLHDFLPVDDGGNGHALQLMPGAKEMVNLKNIVMQNIEKVQQDKGYIKQAESVNRSIATLVSMTRLEIQYVKLLQK